MTIFELAGYKQDKKKEVFRVKTGGTKDCIQTADMG